MKVASWIHCIAVAATALGAATTGCSPMFPDAGPSGTTKPGLRAAAAIKWHKVLTSYHWMPTKPEEFASAEFSPDGRILWVGSRSRNLWALNVATGRQIWKKRMSGEVLSRPRYVQARKTLFLGGGDGCMYALKPLTGKTKWKYCSTGTIFKPPRYKMGVLYFANERSYVYALDAHTGKWRWSYDRELPEGFTIRGHGAPTLAGNRMYVGFSDGFLVSLDARSGDVNWTRDLRAGETDYVDVDSTPVLHKGVLYVTSYAGGVYALTPEGGALRWRFKVKGASAPVIEGDRLYFVAPRRGIHCLDLEGRQRWRQQMDTGTATRPIVYRNLLIFSSAGGGLYFVNRHTGRFVQRFNPGEGISAPPTLNGQRLFLLANGGRFFSMVLF